MSFCKIGNCLRSVEKMELIAKDIQFFNQVDSVKTRHNYLKLNGKIYCLCDREHGVLILYIEVGGWAPRFKLW